ncbi:uncharacterized protein LOC134835110 [Culicoides brevitarsis]|uniref:uncharacterized protein LOC134835110 n=1 Tax=Culicoides brevitarsis TaxID=469753 RepID=UPI00307C511E
MFAKILIAVTIFACFADQIVAQRGFYGGSAGTGYKDRFVAGQQAIGDRFQASQPVAAQGTNPAPARPALPVNAHGDQQLFDRLSQLPREHQPFWFLNYQQLEAQRGQAFPALPAGQMQNNLQAPSNNALDNRFGAPSSQPFVNSPYPIVQGVPGNIF